MLEEPPIRHQKFKALPLHIVFIDAKSICIKKVEKCEKQHHSVKKQTV